VVQVSQHASRAMRVTVNVTLICVLLIGAAANFAG
jgi:hypothetical protein